MANVGHDLLWVEKAKTFRFWKTEVVHHLAEPEKQKSLDYSPDSYFYFASEWRKIDSSRVVILLEKCH